MLNTTISENSNEKSMIKQEMNSSIEESLLTFEFEDIKIFGEDNLMGRFVLKSKLLKSLICISKLHSSD